MKKLFIGIITTLILLTACKTSPTNKTEVKNSNLEEIIINGDVSKGTEKWGLYVNPPGAASMLEFDGVIEYKISNPGKDKWHIQGHYAGLNFVKGASYILSVDMSSTIPKKAQLRIQKDSSPYTAYFEKDIELTTDMQTFKYDFVMEEESDEFSKLCINIGLFDDEVTDAHTVKVDNLSIKVDLNSLNNVSMEEEVELIAINQIGYLPNEIKEVRVAKEAKNFTITDTKTETIVYTGSFTGPVEDIASKDSIYIGDFTSFTDSGEFIINIEGIGKSKPFIINSNVYQDLKDALFKVFYYQRCGQDLGKEAGEWTHGACHTQKATVYGTTEKLDVSGGWHDAGDYGRYVSPGAKAVADLLLSANITKTILVEAKYELDWILKMQDQKSGGVYHKVTTPAFIGSVMPDTDSTELIISPVSPTATADFAAIMALSYRSYLKSDPEYAETILDSALKAWKWLEANPDAPGFLNPEGITTGQYEDDEDGDERFWAAVELFLSTGDKSFEEYAIKSYKENRWNGMGWQNIGTYGVISYILSDSDNKDSDFNNFLIDSFLENVNELSQASSKDGYGISLGTDYVWGSNEVVADNGVKLIIAYKLTGNDVYKKQAITHMNYLLGANSLGQCYVSGFGSNPMENPHHRPSEAVGKAVPGMLAGGPNKELQDPLANSKLSGNPPAKCYIDASPSYSTNEMTIYWNSPLFLLIDRIMEI